MVKNEHGGNKHKKYGRRKRVEPQDKVESGQMFAKIIKNEGDHFSVLCTDNITRKGRMSGKLKRGPRLIAGSFVIISTRDFESDKKNCDIIGIGNPPSNILNIFNQNGNNPTDNINFIEEDEEFKDFQDTKKEENENEDNGDDDFLWDDIDNI